jgi:putative endonuclease
VFEHKSGKIKGFTSKYKTHKLVFFETFSSANKAISAEKKIKGWKRIRKISLIEEKNPEWKDLTSEE